MWQGHTADASSAVSNYHYVSSPESLLFVAYSSVSYSLFVSLCGKCMTSNCQNVTELNYWGNNMIGLRKYLYLWRITSRLTFKTFSVIEENHLLLDLAYGQI